MVQVVKDINGDLFVFADTATGEARILSKKQVKADKDNYQAQLDAIKNASLTNDELIAWAKANHPDYANTQTSKDFLRAEIDKINAMLDLLK